MDEMVGWRMFVFVFAFDDAETRDTNYNRNLVYLEDNAGLVSASLGSARLLALRVSNLHAWGSECD